ncbi:TetR/AcrR family transcriptional regulator [Gorillibacterium timonense]|uniref:TetR/AcrR family transcriptional regulator n=1 Tax=Gorillibacterium timonense TaxID=1689269 RepID=UPI00071CC904|nr:TetR/AcrR family transcriptional regulator [Gorillibacterium timonense]
MTRIVKAAPERRAEIMNAAEQLFMQKGYDNVPISELLAVIGIAKGTFYHHFPSKDALLNAILERTVEGIGERAAAICEHPEMNAPQKLHAVMGAIFQGGDNRRGASLDPDDDRHLLMHMKLTNRFYAKLEPVLVAITRQGIQEGIFHTGNPEDVTAILLRGITGFINRNFREMVDPGFASARMASISLVLARVLGMQEQPQASTRPDASGASSSGASPSHPSDSKGESSS